MRRSLLTFLMLIGTIVCPMIVNAQSNKIAVSDVPLIISEIKKNLPMKVEEGITFTDMKLINDGKQIDFVFSIDPPKLGVSTTEFIKELNSWSRQKLREELGPEFKGMVDMLPLPVSINWVFPNGTGIRTPY